MKGTIKRWNKHKGYGFITPNDGSQDVFLHISQLPGRQPPRIGTEVTFQIEESDGKRQAIHVKLPGINIHKTQIAGFLLVATALTAGANYFMQWVHIPWPLYLYIFMSFLAYLFYFSDKRSAQRGFWRTSEATLHTLEFFGGWPGSFIAQRQFRHKTQKLSFQLTYWSIVLFHLALWYLWFFVFECGVHCDPNTFLHRALDLLGVAK